MSNQINDIDPIETQEWLDALSSVLENEGTERAHFLLENLVKYTRRRGIHMPFDATTAYLNTIPVGKEQKSPGNHELEHRIRSIIRWNAAAMVLRAGKKDLELGGHIASFQSAATLYDVGFNHFWRAKGEGEEGDLVFVQGHSAPGIYARAYVEGRDKYIFTERNGIYIIDLQKTVKKVDEAYEFVKSVADQGGKMLFVGTKKQAQDAIKEEAERSGQYYINHRWLGGTLTNYKTIKGRIDRIAEIEKMEADGVFEVLPKKEVIELRKEYDKLVKFLGGIREMKGMPDAIFVVDPKKEHNAIAEAKKLGIPVVGIVDTNCDPDDVDYVIPANDDAIRAVKLLTAKMADAFVAYNEGNIEETEEAFVEEVEATEE